MNLISKESINHHIRQSYVGVHGANVKIVVSLCIQFMVYGYYAILLSVISRKTNYRNLNEVRLEMDVQKRHKYDYFKFNQLRLVDTERIDCQK